MTDGLVSRRSQSSSVNRSSFATTSNPFEAPDKVEHFSNTSGPSSYTVTAVSLHDKVAVVTGGTKGVGLGARCAVDWSRESNHRTRPVASFSPADGSSRSISLRESRGLEPFRDELLVDERLTMNVSPQRKPLYFSQRVGCIARG